MAKSQDLCWLHVKTTARSEFFNLVNLETAAHAMIVEIELGSLENETEIQVQKSLEGQSTKVLKKIQRQ